MIIHISNKFKSDDIASKTGHWSWIEPSQYELDLEGGGFWKVPKKQIVWHNFDEILQMIMPHSRADLFLVGGDWNMFYFSIYWK